MVLILDLPIFRKADPDKYILALGLPPDIEIITSYPEGDLGRHERVIYITSLESGGKKYQTDLILNNQDVDEWLVLSEDTESYLLDHFKNSVSRAVSAVRVFNCIEELKNALRKPAIKKNSCLICTLAESEYIQPFSNLLKEMLPSWSIASAVMGENSDILKQCTMNTVILLGEKPADFRFNDLSDQFRSIVALVGMERNPYNYIHQLPQLRRQIFGSIPSSSLGESLQKENFYPLFLSYEELRMRCEQETISLIELKNRDNFAMWDEFGLPMPPSVYSDQAFVHSFLSQFDGCKRLAQRLKRN